MKLSYFIKPLAYLACWLIAASLPIQAADLRYTGNGLDDDWNTPENWQGNTVPSDSSIGAAFENEGTHVVIADGASISCNGFMLGMYGNTNTAEMTGGDISCNWLDIGRCNQNGGDGTLTISGGTLQTNIYVNIPTQFSSQTDPANVGRGQLNLLGGTLSSPNLHIGNGQTGQDGGHGNIYLTDGILLLDGNQTSKLQGYIDLGYITTNSFRSFQLDYDETTSGKTTLRTEVYFNGIANSPNPMDGSQLCADTVNALRWGRVPGAERYEVFFGTSMNPPLVATVNGLQQRYTLAELDPNRTYYWRIDAISGEFTRAGPLWSFTTDNSVDCTLPPYTDYCAMLSQEIQGKKHGFLAGNKTYYVGGFTPSWNISGYDTIGFTHPFHNDLRSRGYGMVQDPDTGYGHDLSGWEFYKHTKVAYGTVIVNGVRYENPVPTAMYWRPDRMICEYQVAGINIREDKYIALNDTACSIITSDQPVTLEFEGQSFYKEGITQSTTATCNFDATNNAVHIVEGGVNLVKPTQNIQVPGVMMYDGMSTIISASKPIQNYTNTTASTGQQFYSFSVPCDANGLSLTWAMHDDSDTAIAETQTVLAAPQAQLQAKTDYMNDLLNYQIPYFRCSDQDIVDIYYFLWAIHMMYYIDLSDEDPDFYPHTQTAVNNFLGIHRYDAAMQIPVGSWTVDKASFANGNVLRWKTMLEHADLSTGRIPADNLGKTWYSGPSLSGGVTSHVSGAWQIYQHSGDLSFLSEAYEFYRALMWNAIPNFWGQQYYAADCLGFMALELGYPQSEADHWQTVVNSANFDNWFNYAWTNHGLTNIFTFANPNSSNYNGLGWSSFGYMLTKGFPNDKARAMVETWAVDGPTGFLSDANGHLSTGLLAVRPRNDWDKISEDAFFITPDTNTYMLLGMFATNVDDHATRFALEHLKNYNMKWGIPTAPEAINRSYELFGDQYSNFNAGKILVILEGIFGLSYSVVDDSFTIADNLPLEWDYMEAYVPIGDTGNVDWTHVLVERNREVQSNTKQVNVSNNILQTLHIQPWLGSKSLLNAPGNYSSQADPGHIAYQIENVSDTTLQIQLIEAEPSKVLTDSFRITESPQADEISIQFGIDSASSDTIVILERASQLAPDNFAEIYRFDTSDESESMASGVRANVASDYFTIFDQVQAEGSAFYKVSTEPSNAPN